jgi:RNA polymerase sigma-70 factor, ECF subfamily
VRVKPAGSLNAAAEVALVILAIDGDDHAYAELVRRRQGAIRGLLRRLTHDAALADDLAQQTFFMAWRALRGVRSPAAFGGWLRKLAVNCWLQSVRAGRAEVGLDDCHEPASTDAAIAQALDLDSALGQLPSEVRLCIVLAYNEGMSHGAIAEITALPLGTVKSHIKRGSVRLRELLSDYGDAHVG